MPGHTSRLINPAQGVRTLAQLAAITGSEFDHERARIAFRNVAADADPLSQLASAAAEVAMHVSPVRLPLAEAVCAVALALAAPTVPPVPPYALMFTLAVWAALPVTFAFAAPPLPPDAPLPP